MAGFAGWVGSREHRNYWSRLTDAIRTGRAVAPEVPGKPLFDYLASDPELADVFNRAMTSTSQLAIAPVISACDFSAYSTIVDVGSGNGRLLAAIVAATPHARGILFDLPQGVEGAQAVLEEHHVADRVRILEGSFFDGVPEGGTLTCSRA